MLAAIDFQNPLVLAVIIGWIMSVVLHEFAHGVIGYLGGDYTIRERGGLTLNPFQYIDPFFSLLLPIVFMAMGGIPLPGGVTYIRRDLIRSRAWDSATSLAGPAMSFILFLACAIPLHPLLGWASYKASFNTWTNGQMFLATMAILQLMAVVLNLVPIPPLDGFQAISPFLKDDARTSLNTPPLSSVLFFAYFLVLWRVPQAFDLIYDLIDHVLIALGFGEIGVLFFTKAFNRILYGD